MIHILRGLDDPHSSWYGMIIKLIDCTEDETNLKVSCEGSVAVLQEPNGLILYTGPLIEP